MIHLVHPALVHVPIAFLVVGGIAEAVALLARHHEGARLGGLLVLIGTVALLPTIVAGFLAENTVAVSAAAADALDLHERFGLMLLGVALALIFVKAWGRGRVPESARRIYAAGLLIGVALAVATAILGGRLVYGFGVGVAR